MTRQHGYRIDRATVRNALKPRPEPYWFGLGRGRAVGFRKSAVRPGTWYGRWTEPHDGATLKRPDYWLKSLGSVLEIEYGRAVELAQRYFGECQRAWDIAQNGGPPLRLETVEEACRVYIESLRKLKGDEPADGADGMFRRVVYDDPISKIRLQVLAKHHIENWRNGLVREPEPGKRARTKKGANRLYRQFAAALSYAKSCGAIKTDPWRQVGVFPVKGGRRPGYLTVIQRRAMLEACEREKTTEQLANDDRKELRYCTKDLAEFLRALFFTGARPGELAKAKVEDLSTREQKLVLTSAKNKKGESRSRDFFLFEPEALEFFKRMAEGKVPQDYLVTHADGTPWMNKRGRPNYVRWARGIRAAIREANATLSAEHQIQPGTVAYTARHTVITDLLSDDRVDQPAVQEVTGTSAEMIRQNYYKIVQDRLKEKLSRRQSF
jgi:integrase